MTSRPSTPPSPQPTPSAAPAATPAAAQPAAATPEPTLDQMLRRTFTDRLVQQGLLGRELWRDAVEHVPRHLFVERFHVQRDGVWVEHDLSDPGRRAQALVATYSDSALVTRIDPGNDQPLCASPEPAVTALMLDRLDIEPSQRVLEVGTGTGHTTALLCRALGDHAVTTVDICPDTTARAIGALEAMDFHPVVLCADGSHDITVHGPYHHILATCGVGRVPAGWVHQLTPGGTVVVGIGGLLAVLRRTPNDSLCGRFVGPAGLVPIRHHPHRSPTPTHSQVIDVTNTTPRRDTTNRTATVPTNLDSVGLGMFAGLVAEHGRLVASPGRDGLWPSYRWWDPMTGSWARIDLTGPTTAAVRQYGVVRFWEILHDALLHWDTGGRPPIDQYGITLAPTGRRTLWYRHPHRPITDLP